MVFSKDWSLKRFLIMTPREEWFCKLGLISRKKNETTNCLFSRVWYKWTETLQKLASDPLPRTSSFIPNFHEMCLVRLLFRAHQTACDSPTNKLLLSGTRLPSWRLERIEHGVQLPSSCRLFLRVFFFTSSSQVLKFISFELPSNLFSNVYTSISDPHFWTPTSTK